MIGLIVDGEGDHAAFNARYGGTMKVLKADGPRGHAVSEFQVIDSAKKQIAMLRAWGCSRIAIVTDFEGRSGAAAEFCRRALAHAAKCEFANDVLFFAPDKMLENWLLADVAWLSSKKKYIRKLKAQKNYESIDGKSALKKMFAPGYAYNEVKHSAELFPLIRGAEAEKYSASFLNFRKLLGVD
jgi:hypothetical protein